MKVTVNLNRAMDTFKFAGHINLTKDAKIKLIIEKRLVTLTVVLNFDL